MTRNQIDAKRASEEARANAVKEKETARSNKAREYETNRANRTNESLKRTEMLFKHGGKLLGNAWLPRTGDPGDIRSSNRAKAYAKEYAGAQHPEWYDKYPELTTGVGRYPFGLPTSAGVKTNRNHYADGSISEAYACVCRYIPTYGDTKAGEASMVNVAAKKIYSNIRHANSGSSNYEFQDLMINLMAIDGIYSMIAWLVRLYGLATMYQAQNRSIPQALLSEYGVTEADLLNNVGPLYNAINLLINKASMFVQPADMAITARHMWLAGSVLANPKRPWSEIYMYNPTCFATFNISEVNQAGEILYVDPPVNPTITQLVEWANNIIDNLLLQEDSGIMAGDILKAYGDNVFKLAPIPLDYRIEFVTESNALEQFMNLCYLDDGSLDTPRSWIGGYTQSDGVITADLGETLAVGEEFKNLIAAKDVINSGPYMIRSFDPNITPAQVVSRSRGQVTYLSTAEGGRTLSLDSFGEIVPVRTVIHSSLTQRGVKQDLAVPLTPFAVLTQNVLDNDGFLFGTFRGAQLEYCPMITAIVVADPSAETLSVLSAIDILDRHYYAAVPSEGIAQMHDIAVNSLFYNPGLSKFG